ncbi:MAG TPA: hypothetical protein VEC16_03755 [Alphaproteobacteria bacterium]|nr:hypothetical protein [Alphaproteobacteria bacterium]
MRQDEINRDLKNYITVKKEKPFWKLGNSSGVPKIKPKTDEEVNLMLHGDTHYKSSEDIDPVEAAHAEHHPAHHHLNSQDKEEIHEIETKIKEVDKVEHAVAEEFEEEKEGLFKRLFKKINLSKDDEDDKELEATYNEQSTMDDEELRQLLHGLHNWIIQLPSDKLEKFKSSKEFELYTRYLRKHNLIK